MRESLRAQIPIRTEWTEDAPGFLEVDTVALCGGTLDDRHGWMLSGVDIHTTWSVLCGLPNRSEASVCRQMREVEARLPFALRGVDSDHGGEFINHQLVAYLAGRTPPVAFTRARPYRQNDQAHIEQKNFTNATITLKCGRWSTRCAGALDQLLNYFLPTMKLERKERVGSQTVRHYGPTQTPLARVLACAEVTVETQARLRQEQAALNAFAVRREVDRQMKEIEACRRSLEA